MNHLHNKGPAIKDVSSFVTPTTILAVFWGNLGPSQLMTSFMDDPNTKQSKIFQRKSDLKVQIYLFDKL